MKQRKNCWESISCLFPKKKISKVDSNFSFEKKEIQILYGTQTATSEDFSQIFFQDSVEKYGFTSQVDCIVDYTKNWDDLKKGNTIVVLIFSTYGEGEPTTDAEKFFEYISTCENNSELENLNYVIFGLGDSRYRKYQGMADKTNQHLQRLGGSLLFEIGYGDADKYIEDDFDEWRINVLEYLCQKYKTKRNIVEKPPIPRFEVISRSDISDVDTVPFTKKGMRPSPESPFFTELISKKQLLTNGGDRSTHNFIFNIKGSRMPFIAGDHCAIYPPNPQKLIDEYISRLGYEKDMKKSIKLKALDVMMGMDNKFVKESTLEVVFMYYLDLTSVPRKKAIRFLAEYASNKKEKKKLIKFSSRKGKSLLRKHIIDKRKRMIDILNEYKSIQLPLKVFLEITPIQQVRLYSIASSYKSNKKQLQLCVGLERYVDYKKRKGVGICSGFLDDMKVGEKCYCYVRKSNFYLDDDFEKPVIFVANGTGIASIRSFIMRRKWYKEKKDEDLGDALLFFGCRNKSNDWLYKEEQEEAVDDGIISGLHVAFSRDQKKKIYVQDLIKENSSKVRKMIDEGADVFVCGKMAMSKGVMAVIEECLKGYTKVQIEDFFDNRYKQDVYD